MSLWEHPERIDSGRGTLRGFLGTLTHRRAVDAVRREEARRRREARVAREEGDVPDVAEAVLRSDTPGQGPHGPRRAARSAAAGPGARLLPRVHVPAGRRRVGHPGGHGQVAAAPGVGAHRREPRLRDERARANDGHERGIPEGSGLTGRPGRLRDRRPRRRGCRGIAAHLDASPDAVRWEQDLRSAAGEFAAAVVDDVTPAPELRSRVLAEARRRREPAAVVAGSSPIDVHRVEAGAGHPAAARPDRRRLGPPGRPARVRRLDGPRRRGPPGGQRVAAGPPARRAGARHPRDRHRQRGPHRPGPGPARRPPARVRGRRVGGRGGGEPTPRSTVRGEARLDEPIDWWGGRAADAGRAAGAGLRDVDPRGRHPPGHRRSDGGPTAGVAPHHGSRRVRLRAEHARRPGCPPSGPARPLPIHRPRRRRLGRRPGSSRRGPSGRRRRGRRRDPHRGCRGLPGDQRPDRPSPAALRRRRRRASWPARSSTPSRPWRCSDRS